MSVLDLQQLSVWSSTGAERRRVNDLLGAAKQDHQTLGEATVQIHALLDIANEHASDIARLKAVVYALMQIITEAQLIEANDLSARVAAAIRAIEAPAAEAPRAERAHAEAPPEKAPAKLTSCAVCGREVPLDATLVSERGVVCDACFQPPR